MSIQLYTLYEKVMIPSGASPIANENRFRTIRRNFPRLVLMVWPNGRPCHIANQWLMGKSASSGAKESSETYAALITHILRFCYARQIDFHSMTDLLFKDFTSYLIDRIKITRLGADDARSLNHVASIQQRTLDFFIYISLNVPTPEARALIGEEREGKRITIEWKTNRYGLRYPSHPYLITKKNDLTQNDKIPMPEEFIQLIQNEIFRRHNIDILPEKSKLKYKNNPRGFKAINTYLFERRMFVIRIMKLTGLRPEEMMEISLEVNASALADLCLFIPTMKREKPAPLRKFYLSRRDAMDFNRYVKARRTFQIFLSESAGYGDTSDRLLLTETGSALDKKSVTKEFSRLCDAAGIVDSRACLSMFRHRFISREIHILLLEAFHKNPLLKDDWTEALRDDICHKVARKTGHANPDSIWTYFHEEYQLTTGRPDRNRELRDRDRLESCHESLIYLKTQHTLSPSTTLASKIERIEDLIDELFNDLNRADDLDTVKK